MKRKSNPFGVAFIVCVVVFCICAAILVGFAVNHKGEVMETPESVIFMLCFMMMFVSVILMIIFLIMGIYRARHPVFEKREGVHDEMSEHTVVCPSCHEADPSMANFCEHCGASLKYAQRDDLIYMDKGRGYDVPFKIMFVAQLFTLKPQAVVYVLLFILSCLLLGIGIFLKSVVAIVIACLFFFVFLVSLPLMIVIQYKSLKKHVLSNTTGFYPDGFDVTTEIKNKNGITTKKLFCSFSSCKDATKYKDYYFFIFNTRNIPVILMVHKNNDMKANDFLEESVKNCSKKRK